LRAGSGRFRPDPRTGATRLALDPLEWIHRIAAHIPDQGRHGQRFYAAYSNRAGIAVSSAHGDSAGPAANVRAQQDNSDFSREARSTWARLLRKILEVDPLLCACGARMRIVSRPACRRPHPAPPRKRALQGEASFRTSRSAERRPPPIMSNLPPRHGRHPGAPPVEVCPTACASRSCTLMTWGRQRSAGPNSALLIGGQPGNAHFLLPSSDFLLHSRIEMLID
jgi:hypothetical protein